MFESMVNVVTEVNILGIGAFLILIGILGAATIGLSKGNKKTMMEIMILLCFFTAILILKDLPEKFPMYAVSAIMVIFYGLRWFNSDKPEEVE